MLQSTIQNVRATTPSVKNNKVIRHHSARFRPAIEALKQNLSPLFRQGDVQVSGPLV